VESLCVNLLFSYRNPAHEHRVKELAEEVMRERGVEVPVYLSSEYYPIRGDFPRLNTLVVEAFVAEPSRKQMKLIDARVKEQGARFDLRIMASHGGTITHEARELARTLISGPIGGVIGARWLAERIGLENVMCTDIGGTSFDLAIITGGEYDLKPYPDIARTMLAIPLVETDSVGAGTGSYIRVNPTSNRVEIGPDSAGYRIGCCWPEGGVDTPTITDCNVALGLLNPDYFLGGDIKLDREAALRALEEQVARPLKIDVYEAAAGVVELFEESLKNEVLARILGKGYAPVNYTLLSYGGGGPLHVGGIAEGLGFERVLVPSWAAGFSAFGCACSDFEYRYDASIDLPVLPGLPDEVYEGVAAMINAKVTGLREKVIEEFAKSGFGEKDISFRVYLRMQYLGQLRDLEVNTGKEWIDGAGGMHEAIAAFEDLYGKVYARAAKSPELGYLIPMVIVSGTVDVEKPALPDEPLEGEDPPSAASKGEREIFWRRRWLTASIWEMGELRAGNRVRGPAVIESPSTTLVVPPGNSARLDGHRIFRLEPDEA
jgi:acetone carboxylase beta subunit